MAKTSNEFLLEVIANLHNQLAISMARQSELIEANGSLALEVKRLNGIVDEYTDPKSAYNPTRTNDLGSKVAENNWYATGQNANKAESPLPELFSISGGVKANIAP